MSRVTRTLYLPGTTPRAPWREPVSVKLPSLSVVPIPPSPCVPDPGRNDTVAPSTGAPAAVTLPCTWTRRRPSPHPTTRSAPASTTADHKRLPIAASRVRTARHPLASPPPTPAGRREGPSLVVIGW